MAQEIRVADVRPNGMNFDLTVKVHQLGPVQEIPDRSGMGRRPNRLVEAVVGDASGTVVMSLWNAEVDRVAEGDSLHVRDAYVKLVRGQVRVSVGRGGGLESATQEVDADPTLPNVSDARHADERAHSRPSGDRGHDRPRHHGHDRSRHDDRDRSNRAPDRAQRERSWN